jgi:hypothetical protein
MFRFRRNGTCSGRSRPHFYANAGLTGTLGEVRQEASPRGSYTGDDNFFLAVNVSGASTTLQGDSETPLRGGDAFMAARGNTGFTIIRPRQVRFIGLRMPRAALTPLISGFDEAGLRLVPYSTGALTLLTEYVGAAIRMRAGGRDDRMIALSLGRWSGHAHRLSSGKHGRAYFTDFDDHVRR